MIIFLKKLRTPAKDKKTTTLNASLKTIREVIFLMSPIIISGEVTESEEMAPKWYDVTEMPYDKVANISNFLMVHIVLNFRASQIIESRIIKSAILWNQILLAIVVPNSSLNPPVKSLSLGYCDHLYVDLKWSYYVTATVLMRVALLFQSIFFPANHLHVIIYLYIIYKVKLSFLPIIYKLIFVCWIGTTPDVAGRRVLASDHLPGSKVFGLLPLRRIGQDRRTSNRP